MENLNKQELNAIIKAYNKKNSYPMEESTFIDHALRYIKAIKERTEIQTTHHYIAHCMSSIRAPPHLLAMPNTITIAKKPLSKQLSRGGGRFTCGHCSRQFDRRFSLKRHVAIHIRKKKE